MKPIRITCWSFVLSSLLWCAATAAGETNSIRLAIGPFFAPTGDPVLEKAAAELPDLLTASLPQGNRFQLVERDQVLGIWNEMHLAQAGLTSTNSAVQPGHVLSCDWLVSGTFVKTQTGIQIWVKIINAQDSVVMDLQSVPYAQTNLSTTAGAIADFLAQAVTQPLPRKFIAMGKFNDWSPTTTHEDWSQRLAAMMEKHFLAAGYGVVERDAVAPIFSEYQLQNAGLTEGSTNRLKLKPAFWIVDGSCKWIHETQDELSVSIRIKKMGGDEQVLAVTQPPGGALEKAVLDAVQSVLTNSVPITLEQALAGEQKTRSEQAEQFLRGRGEMSPVRYSTNRAFISVTNAQGEARPFQVNPALEATKKNQVADGVKTLQQAILLDPQNMRAKFQLGMGLIGRPDPAESKQGEDLLAEVAASGDPKFAIRAKNWLADVKSGKITFERDQFGHMVLVTHGQPASMPPVDTNAIARSLAELKAKNDRMFAPQNLATQSESTVTIPPSAFTESAHYAGITAAKLWNRVVLVACGTTLHSFDLATRKSHEIGLPIKLEKNISAIEAEDGVLWLGTGDGLFRVSLADGNAREYSQKDGLPAPDITALKLAGGRLLVGFNGAFGYLDTSSGKFTRLQAGPSQQKADWAQASLEPPTSCVHAIVTQDGNNIWVSSQSFLQHFDLGANKWEAAMPPALFKESGVLTDRQIALNSKYLITSDIRHCFAACRFPETNWWSANLRTNSMGLESSVVALDQPTTDCVWNGDFYGAISLVDLATLKITAQGRMPLNTCSIKWIFPTADTVIFIICQNPTGIGDFSLRCLDKSELSETARAKSVAAAAAASGSENAKVAARSEHPVRITQNPGFIGLLNEGPITAWAVGRAAYRGQLLVACGTNLMSYQLGKLNPRAPMEYPITAMAIDNQDLWLGTDGGGLLRIPMSGTAPAIFNEKNGFPMSSIRSLALTRERLFIGFGQAGMDGSFGWLDLNTLKFTGTQSSGISPKPGEKSLQPPPRHAVWQIKSPDDTNTFWIASSGALYRFLFQSQQWSLQLPRPDEPDPPRTGGLRTLASLGNYTATACPSGGVAIYNVREDRWTHLDLSTNEIENDVTTLALDAFKPGYLWLGGHGKITILNLDTQQIVGEYRMSFRDGEIELIIVNQDTISFIEERAGAHELFYWAKPVLEPSP